MPHSRAPSQRQLRVGELIRHELADIFSRGDVVDPAVERAGVTVTEVQMSPDLRLATAYVRPLRPEAGDDLVPALDRHRRFLRGLLAPRLTLKFVPEVRFRRDTAADYAERIDRLLKDPQVARDIARRDEE
jgi:ribosome-binding factor A